MNPLLKASGLGDGYRPVLRGSCLELLQDMWSFVKNHIYITAVKYTVLHSMNLFTTTTIEE